MLTRDALYVHHGGQGLGVRGVALEYGRVAYEAVGVDAQRKHQQAAVAALLLAAPEFGLAARGLAPLEIKIRQVEENVFVKPNAEGKSRSVCTMLRRENDP